MDVHLPSIGIWMRIAHLNEYLANVGDQIPAGVPVAKSGGRKGHRGAGNSSDPHLHWEANTVESAAASPIDPSPYAKYLILSSTPSATNGTITKGKTTAVQSISRDPFSPVEDTGDSSSPAVGPVEGQIKKDTKNNRGGGVTVIWKKYKIDKDGKGAWHPQTGPDAVQAEKDYVKQQQKQTPQYPDAEKGVLLYLHGDPNRPDFDPSGGHGNNWWGNDGYKLAHDHFSFNSRETAVKAYEALIKAKTVGGSGNYKVTEFEGYGRVGKHSATGGHYGPYGKKPTYNDDTDGTAFDVGWAQFGGSGDLSELEYKESRNIEKIVRKATKPSLLPSSVYRGSVLASLSPPTDIAMKSQQVQIASASIDEIEDQEPAQPIVYLTNMEVSSTPLVMPKSSSGGDDFVTRYRFMSLGIA